MLYNQNIKINEFTYHCTLQQNAGTDDYSCILDYDITDGNALRVKDIYILPTNSIDDILSKKTVFPIFGQTHQFTVDYSKAVFSLVNEQELQKNTTKLNTLDNKGISYDILKIYHPYNKQSLDYVLYLSSIVNDVNIHLFCGDSRSLKICGDTEFELYNETYSEYYEVKVPNIDNIIQNDNILISIFGEVHPLNELLKPFMVYKPNNRYITNNGNEYQQLTDEWEKDKPFDIISNEDLSLDKEYINEQMQLPSSSISILIYPYEGIRNDIYEASSKYISNSDIFQPDYHLSLSTRLGFNENNELSVIGTFHYDKIYDIEEVKRIYCLLNNVTYTDYLNEYIDDDGETVENRFNMQLALGVSTDKQFSSLIYNFKDENSYELLFLDNFIIPINNLFYSWDQLAEQINVKIVFYDKHVGIKISSNPIYISKEYYKYFVTNTEDNNNQLNMKVLNEKVNLVDKAQCYIKSDDTNNVNAVQQNIMAKIIYKPIFFRTHQLQELTLIPELTQNVGINLVDYMSKVDAFKISINSQVFIEYARNDVYVIFKINTSLLTTTSGQYHILNQDDEYISSGNYIIK